MGYETLLVTREDDVGVITLNRPEKRNAIDDRMAVEWGDAVSELNDDDAVGAIVITGAGKAFCAGADVSRFEAAIRATEGRDAETPAVPRRNWIDLVRSSKPIVCAINGACIGAGLTRALPCDVRLASSEASFSMRFVKIGIVPEIGSTQILPQIVGLQVAADLMLSGRTFGAAEALQMGLVLGVVEPDRLMADSLALARSYAENAPNCMVEIKKLLYANCAETDIGVVQRREGAALNRQYGTAENREAVTAFREKRPPDFRKLRA